MKPLDFNAPRISSSGFSSKSTCMRFSSAFITTLPPGNAQPSPKAALSRFSRPAILKKLKSPFPYEDIDWKVQVTNKDKTRGMAVPYLDSRAIQKRLDDAVGAMNWTNEIQLPLPCVFARSPLETVRFQLPTDVLLRLFIEKYLYAVFFHVLPAK